MTLNRSTPVILIAALLIAGWFTGRQLANKRADRAPTDGAETPDGTVNPTDMARMERAAAQARLVKDPRGAAEWLMARATPESLSEHLQHFVARWVENDPNACANSSAPCTRPAHRSRV